MPKISALMLALAFIMAACSTTTPATKLLPAETRSLTPMLSTNSIPTSTLLVIPTNVLPTPTFTPTQTVSTINPTIDITRWNAATQIAGCAKWFGGSKTSPDGQWIAGSCDEGSDNGNNNFRLHIARVDGTKAWQVSFKDITDSDSVGTTNRFGEYVGFPSIPFPYHWYKDSRYLFIAPQIIADGNQSDGLGLYRFDTQTGRYTPFLPVGESSYNFSFSPDDEYYVYSYGKDNKSIHITSLETAEEQTVQVADGQEASFRHFLWSLDSSKFVFIYENYTTDKNTLLLFDTKQKTLTTLLEIEKDLTPIRWESETEVVLEKYVLQGQEWQKQEYLLKINTKVLEKIPNP